jgi:hypothetical protein
MLTCMVYGMSILDVDGRLWKCVGCVWDMCHIYVKGFVGFNIYAKSAGVILPECDALLMRPLEPEGDEKVNAA